jgi:hypothetical protein
MAFSGALRSDGVTWTAKHYLKRPFPEWQPRGKSHTPSCVCGQSLHEPLRMRFGFEVTENVTLRSLCNSVTPHAVLLLISARIQPGRFGSIGKGAH